MVKMLFVSGEKLLTFKMIKKYYISDRRITGRSMKRFSVLKTARYYAGQGCRTTFRGKVIAMFKRFFWVTDEAP